MFIGMRLLKDVFHLPGIYLVVHVRGRQGRWQVGCWPVATFADRGAAAAPAALGADPIATLLSVELCVVPA